MWRKLAEKGTDPNLFVVRVEAVELRPWIQCPHLRFPFTTSNSSGFTHSNYSCLKVRRDRMGDLKLDGKRTTVKSRGILSVMAS